MKKYDIFLVDADNTLLDFHKSAMLALRDTFEYFGVACKDEYLRKYQDFNDMLWERLERKELTRESLMNNRFTWFFKELGFTNLDGNKFNERYLVTLSNRPTYFDGAEEFIKALRENGRVYIVTNGTKSIQKTRFDILGLWEKVDGVFISQEVGADKPDKKFTERVIAQIKDFDKERALWIGDSLSADIKASNDANIDSIWYNPQKISLQSVDPNPTYIAEDFEKILSILQIN